MTLQPVVSRGSFLAVVGLVSLVPPAVAEDTGAKKMLFKPVDMAKAELNPKQSMILDRIKKAKETVGEVKVVTPGDSLSDGANDAMLIPLPGQDKDLEIKGYKLKADESTGAKSLTWKAGDQSFHLTETDGCWDGLIYARGKVYHVQPLGRGLQAITQVDQSKLTDEGPAKKD